MEISPDGARQRFEAARVAHLATVSANGQPHIVPITFAVDPPDSIYFAIDHKPKKSLELRRLRNISENPRASIMVDEYGEDWTTLWWVRADGRADIAEDEAISGRARQLLVDKYVQYRERPPMGPVVVIAVDKWSGWRARE